MKITLGCSHPDKTVRHWQTRYRLQQYVGRQMKLHPISFTCTHSFPNRYGTVVPSRSRGKHCLSLYTRTKNQLHMVCSFVSYIYCRWRIRCCAIKKITTKENGLIKFRFPYIKFSHTGRFHSAKVGFWLVRISWTASITTPAEGKVYSGWKVNILYTHDERELTVNVSVSLLTASRQYLTSYMR